MAILPANVLAEDGAADWMRLGAPIAFQYDLATAPNLTVAFVPGTSGAYQMRATSLLRTTIEHLRGGRIRVKATLSDVSTQRNRQVIEAGSSSVEGLISVLNSVARQIQARATNFSTSSVPALQAFTAAAGSSDLQTRIHNLQAAIGFDPNFGLAYMLLLNTVAVTGQENTATAMSQVASRLHGLTPLDQARLDEIMTRLRHEGLQEQEKTAAAVLELAPNDVDTLAALGTLRFLQGDASSGRRFLERALELSPENSKIRQDLVRGLIQTAHYTDAEKLITNSGDLALCLLLQGKLSEANAMIGNAIQSLSSADLKTLYQANWLAISGQLNKAIETIRSATFANAPAHSAGLVQVAIWQSMRQEFAAAGKSADQAALLSGNRGALATIAHLLMKAAEPAEQWRREVQTASLEPAVAQPLLGYGFFLYGRYPEAIEVWQRTVNQSGDTNLPARAMLASSLERTGRTGDARNVRVQPFLPELGDIYAPVAFKEMRRLIH